MLLPWEKEGGREGRRRTCTVPFHTREISWKLARQSPRRIWSEQLGPEEPGCRQCSLNFGSKKKKKFKPPNELCFFPLFIHNFIFYLYSFFLEDTNSVWCVQTAVALNTLSHCGRTDSSNTFSQTHTLKHTVEVCVCSWVGVRLNQTILPRPKGEKIIPWAQPEMGLQDKQMDERKKEGREIAAWRFWGRGGERKTH